MLGAVGALATSSRKPHHAGLSCQEVGRLPSSKAKGSLGHLIGWERGSSTMASGTQVRSATALPSLMLSSL